MRFILEMDYSPVNWILSWLSVKNLLPLTSSWSLDVIQSLSHVQLFWPHGLQHARFPCPSLSPGIYPNSCPLSQWCHPTVSSSVAPSPPVLSLPSFRVFSKVCSSHQLMLQLQHWSFQWTFRVDFLEDWLVWFSCSPRDSQESSLAPQFKNINSLALSLVYDPTFTSIHDNWKNYSFD